MSERGKEKRGSIIKRTVLSICFLGLSFLLLFWAARSRGFAEWYASRIYPLFIATLGRVYSLIPYSAAEIWLYRLCLGAVGSLAWLLFGVFRKRAGVWELLMWASRVLLGCSTLFLAYTMWCGINYQRVSFSDHAGILSEDYTREELGQLCAELTEEVNRLSPLIQRNEDGSIVLDGAEQGEAAVAMAGLGERYPVLKGWYPRPKKLIFPKLLSVQELCGVYSPFTIEANYNNSMPAYTIPFSTCHELAHLGGFMEEEEANFIAYLACKESNSLDFQYSGSLMAWSYGMSALARADRKAYGRIWAQLGEEPRRNIEENNAFWKQYESSISKTAKAVNDRYLKANGQSEGIKSYGRMVDLLVAYRKAEEHILK